jgi:hypothetical protein
MTDRQPGDAQRFVTDAVRHPRRQYTVVCLDRYGTMALPDVADEVAVWEHDTNLVDIPAEDVASIYLSLYHSHVPALESDGLVQYSQAGDLVSLTDEGGRIANRLDVDDRSPSFVQR